jgi:succinyl-CoA synthetase alpha subunit
MSILIDESKRVIVQGITGREGMARARLMLDYGTRVVGGVTPGKGGAEVLGLPVFNSVPDAVTQLGGADISVLFVPAPMVKPAAIEALDAGVKLVVLVADRVPVWDAMEIAAAAKTNGANFLGPNTLGALSPGRAVVGMLGGRAESARAWFKPPRPTGVGIASRSGGMSSSTGYYLGQAGVRISTIVHVGGDAVLGLRIPDVALMFQDDPATEAIVIFGEIGSSQEEELADLMKAGRVTKPVVAYIGGKAAKEGTRFSHAGAIIEGGKGTHAGKVEALRGAGATVVDSFGELPAAVVSVLRARNNGALMSEAEIKAKWTTGITQIQPNKVAVRGHDIATLMGKASFGAAVYLILTGRLPDEKVGRLMDAILVSSIDHGATPPSCLAARTVASTGASLSQSVAAGISSINRHHGGAIEDCARYLRALIEKSQKEKRSLDEVAAEEVARIKATGERISGFGHRIHTKDPRTARLFELAAAAGADSTQLTAHSTHEGKGGSHVAAARAIERAFAVTGKPLPINVDGAIGAILADLGLDPRVFNGIFMIARTPGLVAHVVEEQTRERPMRRIDPELHAYDGPLPSPPPSP